MRSKHLFGLTMVSGGLCVLASMGSGCGSSTTHTSTATSTSTSSGVNAGSTSTSGSTTSGHPSTTSTTNTSGSSGVGGGGTGGTGVGGGTGGSAPACMGNTIGNAVALTVGGMATTEAVPDAVTPCYYSFTGKAGDRFVMQALAQGLSTDPNHNPNDPSVIDTVVTVYLSDMKTIWARNDDAWPRLGTDSTLLTELPADGTYYLQVEDCNALKKVNAGVSCADPTMITDFTYSIFVGDLTASKAETVGSTSAPATVNYKLPSGATAGNYGTYFLDGDHAATTDVDTFNFTPPTDTATDASARNRAYFWVQPVGNVDGTGSLDNVVVTLKDAANNVLGQADQSNFTNGDDPNGPLQFSVPLDDQFGNGLGKTYTLSVGVSPKVASLTATHEFYIIEHLEGGFNFGTPEVEGPKGINMNDTAATAQTLTSPSGDTGAFFVDGNLSSPTDVDWFTMAAPSGAKAAVVSCSSARDGSGLLGFTAEFFADNTGTAMLTTLGPEVPAMATPLQNDQSAGTPLPTGTTNVSVKISATGQSTTNAGTYYWCSIFIQ